MGTAIAGALEDLRWHWGNAYEITEALGVWRAVRLDNQVALIATDPGELRDLIMTNYAARPVPRPSLPAPRHPAPDPCPVPGDPAGQSGRRGVTGCGM